MDRVGWRHVVVLLLACAGIPAVRSEHRYKAGEPVPFYANKVGPFHNPSETYRYFDLPFCSGVYVQDISEGLGEVLNGDRLVTAPYGLEFLVDKDFELMCKKRLTKKEVSEFREAIAKDYYFQMYYDDLPVHGFLGLVDKERGPDPSFYRYHLFNHLQFEIFYNKDRVIGINAYTDPFAVVDLADDKEVDVLFTYSAKWMETNITFEKRMEKYSPYSSPSFHHNLKIRWFSIINSCVTVLLLIGSLTTTLMRVLEDDSVKYDYDVETADEHEESAWKYIHGDVFRFPKYKSLLAAALGCGTQLFTLATYICLLALVGVFYPYNRGTLFAAMMIIYASTSGIAGYTSASFYRQLDGKNWVWNLLLTGSLFCWPLFVTFCFLNTVAITYHTTASLPLSTVVVIFLIWALVTLPSLLVGGIVGKKSKAEFQAPCRTTQCPREIPPLPWCHRTLPQMALAGALPFSVISIELRFILASVWGHSIYTTYGILFLAFIILVIAAAVITVALTYLRLSVGDHEWWWRSFLYGGSTGLFICGYCLYYHAVSDLSGFMQTTFFLGYTVCVSYAFFLMLGAVGFLAALLFVCRFYSYVMFE